MTGARAEGLQLHDGWTTGDTARQAVFTVLTTADWLQTRDIARHPAVFYERDNWLLTRHPTPGQVDAYFATAILAHAAVSYLLPRGWREGWQYVWIGVEGQKLRQNYALGIRFAF